MIIAKRTRSSGRIQRNRAIGMVLQKGCGTLLGDRALNRPCRNAGLVLAKGHEQHPLGRQNCREAHRDGAAGNVALAEEVGRSIDASNAVEGDQPRDAIPGRPEQRERRVSAADEVCGC